MTCIVISPKSVEHITGFGHPERPERYVVIEKALRQAALLTETNCLLARSATTNELALCHTRAYIDLVQREVGALHNEHRPLSTGDVIISPQSYEVALFAAGGVLTAVDAVMTKKATNAFCLVRPPGHHATAARGMGFCLFNNVAIGARYVQEKYGVKRVVIIDWDVHHGNGTEDIFCDDPSVFYFSTHQKGIYPETGNTSFGNILNCPIPGGPRSREAVFRAFSEQLVPAMEQFRPECVFVSCGFDAHIEDPLAAFDLTDKDFFELTRIVKGIAHQYAGDRLISVLEGGYNLHAIAHASVQHLTALHLNSTRKVEVKS